MSKTEKKLRMLIRKKKIGTQIFFLLTGVLLAFWLNLVIPFFPSSRDIDTLLAVIVPLIFAALVTEILTRFEEFDNYMKVRIVILGTSITFLFFAFVNFYAIAYQHTVVIEPMTFIGIFRSILFASLFSFLERLLKVHEDQGETKNPVSIDRCLQKKEWLTRNKGYIEPIVGAIIVFILSLAVVPFSTVIANADALKALIQADATILGFFGIIVTYILKSLDDKENRWEEIWLQLTEGGKQMKVDSEVAKVAQLRGGKPMSKGEMCMLMVESIGKTRKTTIRFSKAIGTLLVISLLISIWLLSIVGLALETGVVWILSLVSLTGGIAILLLFLGVWFLFSLFKDIGQS